MVPFTVVFSVILFLRGQLNSWHCSCIFSLVHSKNRYKKTCELALVVTVLIYLDFHVPVNQVRSISSQLERVFEEKSHVQSELSLKNSEMTMLKTNEKRLEVGYSSYFIDKLSFTIYYFYEFYTISHLRLSELFH